MPPKLHIPQAATVEWETPQKLFDGLHKEFKFTLDVCASGSNHKCDRYFTKAENGLKQHWDGSCWCNPPYGRQISNWISKGFWAARNGATVVFLVPARTDTRWFHHYALTGEVRFIKGRLKFGGSKSTAPFPSIIVIFRPSNDAENSHVK